MNRLQQISTQLGDVAGSNSVLVDKLSSIVVVGGQVRTRPGCWIGYARTLPLSVARRSMPSMRPRTLLHGPSSVCTCWMDAIIFHINFSFVEPGTSSPHGAWQLLQRSVGLPAPGP